MAVNELGPLKLTVLSDLAKAITGLSEFQSKVATSVAATGQKVAQLEGLIERQSEATAKAIQRTLGTAVPQAAQAAGASVAGVGAVISRAMRSVQTSVTGAATAFSAFAGIAGGGLAKKAAEGFADFDKAITAVRAVTKETDEQFLATRASVIQLATTMKVSATEIANGLNDIVQAGFVGSDAFNLLEASVKGAKAGLTSTAIASNALIATLNAFKIPATQSADVMGKLVRAVDLGIFSFEKLASNIGQVAPQAAASGASLEETLALLTTLTRTELNIDEVTTQLRALFNQIINPGEQVKAKIEAILGTTGEASIKVRGLFETLRLLIDATGGSATALADLFPGIRELAAIVKIAGSGVQELNRDMAELSSTSEGRLNQTLAIQRTSFADLAAQIKSLVGLGFTKFFERNREALAAATQSVVAYAQEHQDLLEIVAGTAVVVGAAVAAIGTLTIGVYSTVAAVKAATTVLALFSKIPVASFVTGAVTAFETLSTVLRTKVVGDIARVAAEMRALKVAMATDQIAQAGGKFGSVSTFDSPVIVTGVQLSAMQKLQATAKGLFPTFTAAGASVATFGKNLFSVGGAVKAATTAFAAFKGLFTGLPALIGGAGKAVLAVLGPIGLAIGAFLAAKKVGSFIGEAIWGSPEELEAAQKAAEASQASAERVLAKASASREQQVDGAKNAAQQVEDAYDRLAKASARANSGDTGAAKEVRAIIDELKALEKNVSPIDTLTAKLANLSGQLAQQRRKIRDKGGGEVEASQAFEQIAGDPKKGQELFDTFLRLQAAVRGYQQSLSPATTAAIRLHEQETQVKGTLLASANAYKRLAAVVEEATQKRRAAGQTVEEKQSEELQNEINTLIKTRDEIVQNLGRLVLLPESQARKEIDRLYKLLGETEAAIAQTQESISKNIEASAKKRMKAEQDVADKVDELQTSIADKRGNREEAESIRAETAYKKRLEEIKNLADADEATKERLRQLADEELRAELDRITKSADERKKADLDRADREKEAAARERKRADEERANRLRQLILDAETNGYAKEALRLRAELAKIEKDIAETKDDAAKTELELLDSTRKRIELLREELESASRTGASGADVARRAQSDILGSSDPVELRGQLRERLKGVENRGTLEAVRKAGRTSLEAEAEDLFKQREKAMRKGDDEEVRRIDEQINAIREKYRVLTEEVKRREAELLALEKQRLDAEKAAKEAALKDAIESARREKGADALPNRQKVEDNLKKNKMIGQDQTVIGRDPKTGRPVTVPTKDLENQSQGTGGVSTPAVPAVPGTPTVPAVPGGTPASGASGVAPQDVLKTASDSAAVAAQAAQDAATAVTAFADSMNVALRNIGDSMSVVTVKLTDLTDVVNQHSAFITTNQDAIRRLRIEGARS